MNAEVHYFPKRCHLHSLPMVWEDLGSLSSGWRCPKCTLTCPTHGDPTRSGIGMLYPVGVLYCRRCRIAQIKKAAQLKRDPSWASKSLPEESGVAHVWRVPT